MTKKELLKLAKKYGADALLSRRKFIGLLPQIYETKAYLDDGCSSIFEFAAKTAGISNEQVRRVLNLEKRFKETPILHNLLIKGDVSHNKLAKVASIVTLDNQETIAANVEVLSTRAIETIVRDFKNENGLSKPKKRQKSVHVNTLELDEDVQKELIQLQEKGININELLRGALKKRKEDIQNQKDELEVKTTNSTYIPVKIKKILQQEYGTKCSYPTCYKDAAHLHHTDRFAMSKRHDPRFLAPLCRAHHEIAHAIDVKVQIKRAVLQSHT